MPTPESRSRRFVKKAFAVVFGLVFASLVAEVALRIAGYSYPIFFQTDIDRGYAPIPGLEGWSWAENKVYIRYNSAGFRDVEHSKPKPPGTYRIAVLGDSYAEARQVPVEAAFWTVIQDQLRKAPDLAGKNVEVLNFGVLGYGTAHELQTLRQRVWEYSPDMVLLTLTVYNDITDNYPAFKGADDTPYFKFDGERLVLDESFRRSRKFQWHSSQLFGAWVALHNHSRLVQLLHHAQAAIKTRLDQWKEERRSRQVPAAAQSEGETAKPATAALADTVGVQNMIFREPSDAGWAEAWRLTEALVKQMRDDTLQHGAKFMLATIPSEIQVLPDRGTRDAMAKKLGVADLFYPDRRLQAFAESENIPFIDIPMPMQAAADRDGTYFHGFGNMPGTGHWNEAGHRFAGELMSKKIEEILTRDQ